MTRFLGFPIISAIVVVIIAMASALTASANDQLAVQMKQMNADFKLIKAQVTDSSQNANTIKTVDDMSAAITTAQGLLPDSVASLPAEQQAAQLKGFQDLLAQLKDQLAEMKADLLKGDNTAAAALLPALNSIKSQGHKTYDP